MFEHVTILLSIILALAIRRRPVQFDLEALFLATFAVRAWQHRDR
jgi:hypothetical protein